MPPIKAIRTAFQFPHAFALIILTLGLFVRFWHMEFVPFQNDADEYAYSLAGQSLLEFGVPISWSSFTYPSEFTYETVTIGSSEHRTEEELTLIRPWFDHPFLLPLIQGVTAEVAGYRFPSIPPSLIMRLPMLVLSGITLWLVYLLGSSFFSRGAGHASLTLMSFSPVFILGQRMVIGENLYTPLMLAALYFTQKNKSWWLPVLLAALSIVSKVPGAVAAILVSLQILLKKDFRQFFRFSLSYVALVLVLFGGYALFVNPQAFLQALDFQSFRLLGWANPTFLLASPGFHTAQFLDATYYLVIVFGFASLVLEKNPERRAFYGLATIALFFTIWGTSAEQDMLGWYKLPLFTFLTILAGKSLTAFPGISIAALSLAVVSNFSLVRFDERPLPTTELLRGTLILIFAILIGFQLSKFVRKLFPAVAITVLLTYIGYSFYFSHSYYKAICTHRDCPVPLMTSGQLLKSVLP